MKVIVQAEAFDPYKEVSAYEKQYLPFGKHGGVVTFVGTMRDFNDGHDVSSMFLEYYPGMTERALEGIVAEAGSRWRLIDVLVVHRVGELKPTDQIVLVAVTSANRGEAFAACEFIIDYLKTRAPFWKKERTPEGAHWVEARVTDDDAAARWESQKTA